MKLEICLGHNHSQNCAEVPPSLNNLAYAWSVIFELGL